MDFLPFSRPAPAKRTFRKCPPEIVALAWAKLWDPQVVRALDRHHKMQWDALKASFESPPLSNYRVKACRALRNLFVCWSHANPEVPVWTVIRGTDSAAAPTLLAEFRACPPPPNKTSHFLWKDRKAVPVAVGEWGAFGRTVWNEEVREAEQRALARIREWQTTQEARLRALN